MRLCSPRALPGLIPASVLSILMAPGLARAAATGEGGSAQLLSGSYLLQVVGSLLLVLGCIVGLLLLMKKINGLPINNQASLKVLSSTRVGSREKILLLEAGEKQLLVGVAAGSVRTLLVFDEPAAPPGPSSGKAEFSNALQKARGLDGG